MRKYIGFIANAAAAFGLLTLAQVADADETDPDRTYVLGTASSGGTYYPVGVAIAALVEATLSETTGMTLTARPTAGTGANMDLLRTGEVQFALVQGLFVQRYADGTPPASSPAAGLSPICDKGRTSSPRFSRAAVCMVL